jgi:DNA repair protein RadA/Sms
MATKAAVRPGYKCEECGAGLPKWFGRCPECQAWGGIVELGSSSARTAQAGVVSAAAVPMDAVDVTPALAAPTGVDELDRVLGGGLVPGAVVLLAGEPGVGKSTLLLEVATRTARDGARTLIVSGEESVGQVRLRAGRTGALNPHLFLAAETDLGALLAHVEEVRPAVLVVDSVQTFTHPAVDGAAGGVSQVREVAGALVRLAKQRSMATLVVGHVTKDGGIAGPRTLEHLVDVVLSFEGDRHSSLRMVRAVKNRFGAADEVGCFELTETGIVGLPDPSGLFLSRPAEPVAGTCVTVTVEGRRPLVAEVQALVGAAPSGGGEAKVYARRASSGLDQDRVTMTLAVVAARLQLPLGGRDVYTSTVGGQRICEPAADLAVALAVASAHSDRPLPPGLIAVGEVGLSGDVRRVPSTGRRLAEAARLGFTRALVPPGSAAPPAGMQVVEVETLGQAAALLGLAPSRRTSRSRSA